MALPGDKRIKGFETFKQGAEARLFKGSYLGRITVLKERFVKKYRHPSLDMILTKERTKAEARAIVRAKAVGVPTPTLYLVDFDRRRIYMEYVDDAVMLKDFIDSNMANRNDVEYLIRFIGQRIGSVVGQLHSNSIIHGDLTTSNMLLKKFSDESQPDEEERVPRGEIYLIDFGLAKVECTAEDKAVDLYVLERALTSTHSQTSSLFGEILNSYQKCQRATDNDEVMAKYKEVRARGRKRMMIG